MILKLNEKNVEKEKKIQKRAVNGQPINLYVEMLIVADCSIYDDHQRFANTTNQDLVYLHMRIYFSHLVALVNRNTLKPYILVCMIINLTFL